MVAKVRKYSVNFLKDSPLFYEQVLSLFERYAEIEIDTIPPEYLYKKRIW